MTVLLQDLSQPDRAVEHLAAGDAHLAKVVAETAESLTSSDCGGERPAQVYFVPGRIEVLGKHTDYAGGMSITTATEQGFCIVAAPTSDSVLRLHDLARHARVEIPLRPDLRVERRDWSRYPDTVASRLAKNFGPAPLRGVEAAFSSNLPRSSGMSSSSALVVASYLALSGHNGIESHPEFRAQIESPEDLAGYLGTVENGQTFGRLAGDRGVGTFGGSEDHTAILCSQIGHLNLYRYGPVRLQARQPWPKGWRFAIAMSGLRASKAGAARGSYNRASLLASAAAECWRKHSGSNTPGYNTPGYNARHLGAALAETSLDELRKVLAVADHGTFAADELVERLEHFAAESEEIVPSAWQALAAHDLETLGSLVDRSQALAEEKLHNQVAETVTLARKARQEGAAASSAFGGGFGGSVWALVREEEVTDFLCRWRVSYLTDFPSREDRAQFLSTGAAAGARRILG